MQPEAIIFVDTNFFLHYKQAKEIDWRSVADADIVRLMVTPALPPSLDTYIVSQHGYQMYEHEAGDQIEIELEKDNGVIRVDKNQGLCCKYWV